MKPRTFRQGILMMQGFFDPEEGRDLTAIIQFNIRGEEPGLWHFVIRDGECRVREGLAESPATLTITTPSQVWLKIMRGELNGPEAFMSGLATASGDIELLFRFGRLFSQYK